MVCLHPARCNTNLNGRSFFIQLSNNLVTPEKVEKALRAVQLSQFIDMKNTIGENGVLLSGGEKQRLSLARAFTSNCPIILMDEATSQLDNENMDKIENLVLDSDKTVISITHRLVKRVLQKYDKIYIIRHRFMAVEQRR